MKNGDPSWNQSVWKRAYLDSFGKGTMRKLAAPAVGLIIGLLLVGQWNDLRLWESLGLSGDGSIQPASLAGKAIFVSVVGLTVNTVWFLVLLIRAPVRQRDEARAEITRLHEPEPVFDVQAHSRDRRRMCVTQSGRRELWIYCLKIKNVGVKKATGVRLSIVHAVDTVPTELRNIPNGHVYLQGEVIQPRDHVEVDVIAFDPESRWIAVPIPTASFNGSSSTFCNIPEQVLPRDRASARFRLHADDALGAMEILLSINLRTGHFDATKPDE